MGSIYPYETSEGKRRYKILYRKPDNRQTTERGFSTKKEAALRLAEVEVSKSRGEFVSVSDGNAKIGMLAESWLAGKKGTLRPEAYRPLESAWRMHVRDKWATRAVASIRHSEVQSWVSSIDRSATIVIRAHSILAGVLDAAVKDRRIARNVARGVDLPRKKPQKVSRYLSHEELWRLAAAAGPNAPLVLTLGYCGMRWGELAGLHVADFDPDKRRLSLNRTVTRSEAKFVEGPLKGYKRRQTPVPRVLADIIGELTGGRAPDAPIFTDRNGDYLIRSHSSENQRSWWAGAQRKAGIGQMVLHDLRHTAASLAVSAGANVLVIQRMLGHRDASETLNTYSDLFDTDLNTVSDRLDSQIANSNVVSLLSVADSE